MVHQSTLERHIPDLVSSNNTGIIRIITITAQFSTFGHASNQFSPSLGNTTVITKTLNNSVNSDYDSICDYVLEVDWRPVFDSATNVDQCYRIFVDTVEH